MKYKLKILLGMLCELGKTASSVAFGKFSLKFLQWK